MLWEDCSGDAAISCCLRTFHAVIKFRHAPGDRIACQRSFVDEVIG
jgi:hypothetical protein